MVDGTLQLPDDFDRSDDSAPARFVGNYQLIRLIGSGAMGEVHLARHRQFQQRQCAVKLIRSETVNADARKRFEREIIAMGGLVHPNLVYAMDAGIDQDRMYLVMEYVAGRDLQSRIDNEGPFSAGQAAEVLRQICAGVAHAHQHGVVHRDIKPANVLLSKTNEVKVLDLGIASLQSDAQSRMTHGGTVMGTAPFIAPELWDDAMNASAASDVYAIGCTAYCLLTGQPPFSGEAYTSLVQVMTAHRQADPTPLDMIREDIPSEFSSLIMRSLSKDRDRRFHDAAEFGEHLAPFAEPLSVGVSEAPSGFATEVPGSVTTGRARSTNRHLESLVADSFGVLWWTVPILLLLIGLGSLAVGVSSDFVTDAWMRVFAQWGKPTSAPRLGLILDATRLLLFVPIAWYTLTRYYPSEVRQTASLRIWNGSKLCACLLIIAAIAAIAHFVIRPFWIDEALAGRLASLAGPSDVDEQTTGLHWYSAYASIAAVVLPVMVIVFPIAWFIAGDVASVRSRFADLLVSQAETSYAGRMQENLHRYGNDLRDRAGRLLAVFFVATLLLQYDYWTTHLFAAGIKRELVRWPTIGFAIAIGIAFIAAVVLLTTMYARGYEATARATAVCGSVKDVDDLAAISPAWMLRSTLFRGLSGAGYMTLLLIIGHWIWIDGLWPGAAAGNTSSLVVGRENESIDQGELTVTWLPRFAKPTENAKLVKVQFRGSKQVLYSELKLQLPLKNARLDPIVMLLVPQTNSESPDSFYIMREKVSAALFNAFSLEHPSVIDEAAATRRQSAIGGDEPVYDVTGKEAIDFGTIVGEGKLPTPQQWDTAFGRYFNQADINATIECDEPFPDYSNRETPWGCEDMGSRGLEWTRLDAHWQKNVPHNNEPHSLQLRGWSQFAGATLQSDVWEDSAAPDKFLFGTRPFVEPSDEISFRLVLDQD